MVLDQSLTPLEGIDRWFSKTFTEFVIEGMYRYVRPGGNNNNNANVPSTQENYEMSADLKNLELIGRADSIDLLKLNLPSRLLVILSNVSYLQGEGLRNLCNLFSNENISVSPISMVSALTNVERAVTQLFLQGQIGRIIGPIQSDWLKPGSESTDITSLSPAIFKSLLSLSDVQSLISDVSPKDPLPLMRELCTALISSMLNCVKENANLTKEQVIRSRIDVEFVKRKLEAVSLLNPESVELLERLNAILTSSRDDYDFYSVWGQFENNWTGPLGNIFSFAG